jgi:hypothetical protein
MVLIFLDSLISETVLICELHLLKDILCVRFLEFAREAVNAGNSQGQLSLHAAV